MKVCTGRASHFQTNYILAFTQQHSFIFLFFIQRYLKKWKKVFVEQNERKVSRKSLSHKLGHFFHEFFLVVGFYFHLTLTSSLSLSLIYLSIFPKFLVFTQTDNCSFSTYWIYMGIDLIREKEKKFHQ